LASALTNSHLVDALLQHIERLAAVTPLGPPLVHRRERNELPEPMRSVRHNRLGTKVVDPVEVGLVRRRVVPAEEEVDGVRSAGADGVGEGAADPRARGVREERRVVTDVVQADVALDKVGKVVGVAGLAAVRHGEVGAEDLELVLVRLELED
jgi:hypothetical protein